MKMPDPPLPDEILRGLYLEPLDLTVNAAAERLGMARKALYELVSGHTHISREVAIRMAKAFPNTSFQLWLDPLVRYAAWQAKQPAASIRVTPVSEPEPV
jgi:addiction module HigA family antidote